ncbi:hypothetical protein DFH07DRAFT_955169 [Mycena maculata]|uniref:Uncharacterized protein n=1 Tax=Mycena maculata TaxID=230809 RepID=A0AAD7JQ01_9AGAR|nr:hypothetical protein DFH07DRAFT_955169 [Mycena maculata]
MFPPSTTNPHPFALYDVSELDWTQFIEDVRTEANLTPQDHEQAYCVPILSCLPDLVIATAVTYHISKKKPRLVGLLVDKWNHYFFHPRKMVILMRGAKKLSGKSNQPVANLYAPYRQFYALTVPRGVPRRGKTYRLFVVSMEA